MIASKQVKKTTKKKHLHRHSKVLKSDYGVMGLIKENKGLLKILKNSGEDFMEHFPTEKDSHFFTHTYTYRTSSFIGILNFYSDLYEYLDISNDDLQSLKQNFWSIINPELNRTKINFEKNLNHLLKILATTDEKIYSRLILLSKVECIRLEEAISCLDNNCNLSSVVMSVSAVENRLHKLIAKKNNKIYKERFEKNTLGGIISLFRKDCYTDKKYLKLKEILPEEHKPLIEMLNIYRIFSAHPKDIVISNQTAKLILSLSFLFVIDKQLQV